VPASGSVVEKENTGFTREGFAGKCVLHVSRQAVCASSSEAGCSLPECVLPWGVSP